MMGLQATSGKRKLEGGGAGCMDFEMDLGESPNKLSRMEASWWTIEDHHFISSSGSSSPTNSTYFDLEITTPACLQSAASDSSHLTSTTSSTGGASPASTAQSVSSQSPSQQQQQQYYQQRPTTYQQQQQQAVNQQQLFRWHYEPPTIRREENGKSYLELGSSSYRATASLGHPVPGAQAAPTTERCCEGTRASWCRRGRTCYKQSRLAVVNISMCKLARYRQFPDPSLHRSVLICNTLRYLEREMERDRSPPPTSVDASTAGHQQSPGSTGTTTRTTTTPPTHSHTHLSPPPMQLQAPEQGRLTPFPMSSNALGDTDVDSGLGDSDDGRSINWGSVLSLSSQSPLDPLNNNELLDVDIGPEFELDFMPSWKPLAPAASPVTDDSGHHEHDGSAASSPARSLESAAGSAA